MMKNFKKYWVCFLLTIIGVNSGFAIPLSTTINYQGEVIFNGSPANGNFEVNFALFDSATSGNQELFISQTLTINNGLINTELNLGEAPTIFNRLWLEISIQDPVTLDIHILEPRVTINPSAYAIRANEADNALQSDIASVANQVIANSVNSSSVLNGSLQAEDLTDFTINNSKIANQVIGFEKLAINGASDGSIIQYNSTSGEWEAVSPSGVTTPWADVGTGIFYQGNVGIGAGSSFSPNAPLDIRSILDDTVFKVNLDGSIQRTLQTRVLTLGYQAFTPEKSSFKYEINSSGTIAGLSNVDSINNTISLYAPVVLPHGAIITKLELLAFDDDPANQIIARLKRTSFTTNNASSTLSSIGTGIVPTPGEIVITSSIFNQNYFSTSVFYAFIAIPKPGIPGTDLIFSGVKITYEIDEL